MVVSKLLLGCTEYTSMTDCSAQRSTPKYANKKKKKHFTANITHIASHLDAVRFLTPKVGLIKIQ